MVNIVNDTGFIQNVALCSVNNKSIQPLLSNVANHSQNSRITIINKADHV